MMMNVSTPVVFLVYMLIFFIAILFRYFLTAGIFHYYYYVRNRKTFDGKRLNKKRAPGKQLRQEMIWSTKSSAIFAFFGALAYWLWEKDLTAVYLEPSEYGSWYLPASLVAISLIHETYYYWIHRWMHHPRVFRIVHKVHHDSRIPTPWSAFSFHPWESLIEALILPLIVIIIPVNIYVLGLYLLIMTVSSVINHLDIEIYPRWFQENRLGKLFIGATHHHLHHKEYMTNYGLYFTFWDKFMSTESRKMK